MLSFLKKPYPTHDPTIKSIWISLGTGIFIGLFLILLRPFGLHELSNPLRIFLILGYGVITFLIAVVFLYFIPKYSNIQNDENWTVGKEILYMNIMIILIAACNTLYTPILSPYNLINFESFLHMIFNTFLVGVIPVTFFVMHDHNQLLTKHVAESESIQLKPIEQVQSKSSFTLNSNSESVEIYNDQLLFIESVGNYTNIIIQQNGIKETKLFRSTMKNIESQIQDDHIIRCHRSYFVNLNKVDDVKGNAQGFKLSLKNCEDVVPVSRKFVPVVKAYFAQAK